METMLNPNAIPDGSITQEKIESSVLSSKQDTIPDLDAIRQGAQKGSTALQSESDPVYLADKPNLALKSEIPDISVKVDKVAGKGLSTNDYTDEEKAKLDSLQNYDDSGIVALINNKSDKGHTHTVSQITDFPSIPSKVSQLTNDSGFISSIPSEYVTDAELNSKGYLTEHQDISGKADVSYVDNKISTLTNVVNGKQDNISDLTAIRNGAALGSTAIQEETDPTVPAWAKSEKKPSYTPSEIGAASQEALQSHVNDNVKHITAAERTAWNAKQDALTAGFGISISGGEISSTLDTNPFIVVSSLPSSGVKDKIYIAPSKNPETGNLTDEWIWNGSAWELLGAPKVDLSDYATESWVENKGYLTEHQDISGKADKSSLAAVATSGSYNDLSNKPTIPSEQVNADWNATSGKAQILNKPTIPSAVTESTVSGWGFTKNTGTYSKPSTGIPKSDLESAVQTSLGKADTALQSYTEQYKGTITGVSANGTSVATSGVANIPAASTSVYGVTKLSSATNSTSTSLAATASAVKAAYDLANSYKGTVTGVKINGTTKNPSNGVVDLGTVITSHQDISGKQDKLVSGTNIKTINGESILGSGDITISGGGSGGGGAYPEVNHGTSDTTFTLTPNTFHVWDEVTSLTLTFGSETSGVANEYLFQFTSGSTATSLTLPNNIKWVNNNAPTIGVNMIYQVSVLKRLASVLEFNNAKIPSGGTGN